MEHEEKQHMSENTHSHAEQSPKQSNAQPPTPSIPPVLTYLGLGTSSPMLGLSTEQLIAALTHPTWTIRVAAVRQLGKQQEQAPIEYLVKALQDEHVAVRAAAAGTLGRCGGEVPLQPLIAALHDPEWHVRTAAARALGEQGTRAPVEPLLTALQDEDASVRASAAWAMSKLTSNIPTAPLVKLVDDPSWPVREAASQALDDLGLPPPTTSLFARSTQHEQMAHHTIEHTDNTRVPTRSIESLTPATNKQSQPIQIRQNNQATSPAHERIQNTIPEAHSSSSSTKVTHIRPKLRPRPTRSSRFFSLAERSIAAVLIIGIGLSWLLLSQHFQSTTGYRHTTKYAYFKNTSAITSVVWSAPTSPSDGKGQVAIADQSGRVQILNTNPMALVSTYSFRHVLALTWPTNEALRIANLGADGTIQLLKPGETVPFMSIPGLSGEIPVVAWSPNGKQLAVTHNTNKTSSVDIWDTTTGQKTVTYTQQSGMINTIAWPSAKGTIIATASDKKIELWQAQTGQSILRDTALSNAYHVITMAWSPDGTRLAYTLTDGEVWQYDVKAGVNTPFTTSDPKQSFRPSSEAPWIGTLAWSPDGTHLASTEKSGWIQVWDTNLANLLYPYNGHTSQVASLAWSSDGSRIASAGTDGTLLIWGAM